MSTASERFPRLARLTRSPLVWVAAMIVAGLVMKYRPAEVAKQQPPPCPGRRGVTLIDSVGASPADAGHPAGLFIGVHHFESSPPPSDVTYAIDDAVDLAAAFSDRMIEPRRIVLAIAGWPRKTQSRNSLQKLIDGGAQIIVPTKAKIECALDHQAKVAGKQALIVTFATHGYSTDGTSYVLGSNSNFEDRDSAISTAHVLDVAAKARQSFIVFDACRDRTSATRARSHRVDTRAPLLQTMHQYAGQVVFAPAAGLVTDEKGENGAFTKAILDGLDGGAACSLDGHITVDALQQFVEDWMLRWFKRQNPGFEPPAIQVNMDGNSAKMPLAACDAGPPIGRVDPTSYSIDVYDTSGKHLWGRRFEDAVIQVELLKPENLVVVAAGSHVHTFNRKGTEIWTGETGKGMFITKLLIDKFVHGVRANQVLALATGDGGSTIAMWDASGQARGTYRSRKRLLSVVPFRLTARHGWKLVTAWSTGVAMLDPKNLAEVWSEILHPPEGPIRGIRMHDPNDDGKVDIAITFASGSTLYLDARGHRLLDAALAGAAFD